jgi:hypothetical protein
MVLAKVRLDVDARVQAREVDPGSVARVRIFAGPFDEHAHLRQGEQVATGADVGVDDGESERSHRGDDEVLFRSGWEVHDDGAGVSSEFDLEVCGGCGGLGWCLDFGFGDLRIDDGGRGRAVGRGRRRNGACERYADHNDVHEEERSDQAAAVLH